MNKCPVSHLRQLPDTQLLETFYPSTTKAYQEPDGVEVHKKLARRNVTLKLLYDAYKPQVVRRAYTYFLLSPLRRVAASQQPWRTQRQRPSHPW